MNRTRKTLALFLIAAIAAIALMAFSSCSTTRIESATFHGTTINSATWKSQAGVGADATIEATTSPKTEASLTGM